MLLIISMNKSTIILYNNGEENDSYSVIPMFHEVHKDYILNE